MDVAPEEVPPPRRPQHCLFGGSFDPVHRGHLAMAEAARRQAGMERVIFLPCHQSPHKAGRPPLEAEKRLELLEMALDGLPWATLSTFELVRPGPSFSWETATHFSRLLPDVELCWLLGGDQWAALERWSHPEILARLLHFIVLPRAGHPAGPKAGFRATILPDFHHPASATAVRDAAAKGDADTVRALTPPAVAEAILQRGYYR